MAEAATSFSSLFPLHRRRSIFLSRERSLNGQATIDRDDLVVHISGLDHPDDSFSNLFRLSQPADGNSCDTAYQYMATSTKTQRGADLLAANSVLLGNIFVSSINAGATPFTVMPFFPYAPANQCTSPCMADLEDLQHSIGQSAMAPLNIDNKTDNLLTRTVASISPEPQGRTTYA